MLLFNLQEVEVHQDEWEEVVAVAAAVAITVVARAMEEVVVAAWEAWEVVAVVAEDTKSVDCQTASFPLLQKVRKINYLILKVFLS